MSRYFWYPWISYALFAYAEGISLWVITASAVWTSLLAWRIEHGSQNSS